MEEGGKKRSSPFAQMKVTMPTKEKPEIKEKKEEEEKAAATVPKKVISPPPPPPPAPTKSSSSSIYFMLRLCSFACVIIFGIGFYGVVSASLIFDVSMIDSSLHLLHLKTLPPRRIAGKVYPIVARQKKISVKSFYNLNFNDVIAKPLINSLEPSFEFHLKTGTQFGCLCMHQLQIGIDKQYRVCSIRNMKDTYLVVNPNIVGYSNQTRTVKEITSMCNVSSREKTRSEHIFLEWSEPPRGHRMYARLEGEEALCMQQVLEEMEMGSEEYCKK